MAEKGLVLFAGTVGKVFAAEDPAVPGTIKAVNVGDLPKFDESKAIITRMIFNEKPNLNFMNTVGGAIHLYVYGDDIGGLMVSGLAFDDRCKGEAGAGGGEGAGDKSGIENIINYYRENKASTREEIITITIGAASFRGYLIGINGEALDPRTRIWQFNLQFAIIPDAADFAGGGQAEPGVGNDPPAPSPGGGGSPGYTTLPNDPVTPRQFPDAASSDVADSGGGAPAPLIPVTAGSGYVTYNTGAILPTVHSFLVA